MIINNCLAPLFLDENKKPIYNGPVYLVFGQVEEDLARQHTNDYVRKETLKAKENIRDKIKLLKEEIKGCKKQINTLLKDKIKGDEQKLTESAEIKETIVTRLEDLGELNSNLSRITMTNLDEQSVNLAFLAMKSYIRDRLEEAIPNCKVISTGDGFIKAGGEIIKVVYTADKLSKRVSDNLMDKLVEKTRENLPLGEKPYMVISGGLSSTYVQVPVAYVDAEEDVMRNESAKTITLLQLPTCLDSDSLMEIIQSKVGASGNEMTKLATKNDFSSGAVIVEKVSGIQRRKFLTAHYLSNEEAFKDPKKILNYGVFYGANFGDQHHGSKYVSIVETKDSVRYAFDVAQDFIAKIGAQIVRITSLGDEIQAKNYDTAAEDHKDNLPPGHLEDLIIKLQKTIKDPAQFQNELKKLEIRTKIRAGIDMPMNQKDDFMETINYDLFKQVLQNYRSVGMTGPMFQIIEGNHSAHTFEGLVVLSKEMAHEVALRIGATSEEVIAPLFSKLGLYVGKFGIKDHYQYGEYARHKQGGAKNSKDPARATRTAFTKRGQDFSDLIDRYAVNRAGHTHMGGQTASRNVFHDIGYCFMDRNEYGEQFNFGSPARGFKIEGQPVDGWQNGPIVTIEVPIEYLSKWANQNPKVDTEKLFENSIVKPKK